MADVYRDGAATITVDQTALRRALDRVSGGAASSFIRRFDDMLDEVRRPARARWPVRTGRSRDGFRRLHNITEHAVEVVERNVAATPRFGPYAFKIRWSVRTEASLDAEARRAGERGTTPESKASLRNNWRKRLARRHGRGAPSEQLAGKQPWRTLVRTPANRAARKLIPELQADLDRLAGSAG